MKPILDVVIGLAPGIDPDRVITALQPLSARLGGQGVAKAACCWWSRTGPPTGWAHLHLVGHGDPQWRRYLALRDRLRADPAARSVYAQLKGRLAAQFSVDRRAYTAAKAAFIQQLLSEDVRMATPNRADQ